VTFLLVNNKAVCMWYLPYLASMRSVLCGGFVDCYVLEGNPVLIIILFIW